MKKRLSSMLMVLVLVMSLFGTLTPQVHAYTGDGTLENPYMVTTYGDLRTCLKLSGTVYIRLGADISSNDSQSNYHLGVAAGEKHLDLNGYSISRVTSGTDSYMINVGAESTLYLNNYNLSKTSKVTCQSTNPEVNMGLLICMSSATVSFGSAYGDPIVLDMEGTVTDLPGINIYGNLLTYPGVEFAFEPGLYVYSDTADVTIFGGAFDHGLYIPKAKSVMLYEADLGRNSTAGLIGFTDYLLQLPYITELALECTIFVGEGMDETTELQMNQQYTYIPSTYTDIHIMYDGDPDVIIEPADASGVADGDTTLRFRTGVLFADTYEWRVAEDKLSVVSEDLSWNEVAQHCTYSGVNSNTLLLTPKAGDTWLDGKCVYCVVWRTITLPSRNDTSWARITLTAPTLPEFEILKQPPYGNCTVGESMVFDVEARGVSNYVWRICEDGTYQTYDWSEVTQHASYTADQNKITIQPTDTWLNDKLIYCDMYGTDGTWLGRTSLRDMIVKEAEVEPPHTHSLKTKTTRATLTKNGKIEKVCDCGYVASTTTIYHPVNYDLSTIQYVYNGKVKAPKLNILDTEHNFIPSTYYTVEKDAGRKEVGKYAYTITFKGRYSGTKKVYFTILPPATSIKTLTARSKGFLVNWTQKSNGVSGYQVQYSRNSSFKTRSTLTLTKNTTTTKTVTKLLAKKRYYVRVRTYKKVGNTTFFSQWSDTKSIITKL